MPYSSTPARPLPTSRACRAWVSSGLRPTNRGGSAANPAIARLTGSRPAGGGSRSPAAGPSSAGVARDTAGAPTDGGSGAARGNARANATSTGWPCSNSPRYICPASSIAKSSTTG